MADPWSIHHGCGGTFEKIGMVPLSHGDVPYYRCDRCDVECDASESEMFEGYWIARAAADLRDEVRAEQEHPNVLADGTVDTLRLVILRARLKAALEAIRAC